jgi:hypothetical protein
MGDIGNKNIIIHSDGGPGHYKVYKTQRWMSEWACELNVKIEWNIFFVHRGFNLCDGHAGHGKRQVRKAEENFTHIFGIDDIIPCLRNHTTVIELSYDEIKNADEPNCAPVGKGFISKYHHFTYEAEDILLCKYIKGVGSYQRHKVRQTCHEKVDLECCGICGDPEDDDNDYRYWIECDVCSQ